MLSGRGICDGLITRLEESYRLWCVVVCDLENLKNEETIAHDWAVSAIEIKSSECEDTGPPKVTLCSFLDGYLCVK